jgi:hypothetical protein
LFIHINTFRQRLGALDASLGAWRDSGRMLDIHMALRLWCLKNPQAFSAETPKISENTP